MVQYECDICSKIFTKKSNYDYHKNRKNKCKPIIILKKCEGCNIEVEEESFDIHIKICKDLKILELEKQLKEFKEKYEPIVINNENTTQNTIQNTTQNITTQNNIVNNTINNTINNPTINNITVINYGSENINSLTEKEKLHILSQGFFSIIERIKLVHSNDRIPQQINLYLTNLKSKFAYKYMNNKFELTELHELLKTLFDNSTEDIKTLYESYKNKLTAMKIKGLENLFSALDKDDDRIFIENKDKMIVILYNNRDKIDKILDK
jgi:hypothetical protein